MSEGAKIIRFPVERRHSPVLGTADEASSEGGTVKVTLTDTTVAGVIQVAGVGPITGGSASVFGESWWERVPPVSESHNDRTMWMKLGLAPDLKAKRHRVIALSAETIDGKPILFAQAACGRRAPLSKAFDDAWSGGDCAGCYRRGWR